MRRQPRENVLVHFLFNIGDAFLDYKQRQITIAKNQLDYGKLVSERLSEGKFTMILPRGETRIARMYHYPETEKKAEYYQLLMIGDNRELPDYIKLGQQVFVLLTRLSGKNYAIMEFVP